MRSTLAVIDSSNFDQNNLNNDQGLVVEEFNDSNNFANDQLIEPTLYPAVTAQTIVHYETCPRITTHEEKPLDYVPKPKATGERDIAYFGSWWVFDASSFGGISQSLSVQYDVPGINPIDDDGINSELQFGTLIANGSGLIPAFLGHFIFKKYKFYKKGYSINPIYRTFDTIYTLASSAADILSYFPLPFIPNSAQRLVSTILGGILGFVFGLLVAVPYWLYRQYFSKTPVHERNYYSKTGMEGWCKYAKTSAIIGNNIGKITGFTLCNNLSSVNLGASIGGISGFFIGLIGIPAINYMTSRSLMHLYSIEVMSLQEYCSKDKELKPNSYNLIYIKPDTWKLIFVDKDLVQTPLRINQISNLKNVLPKTPEFDDKQKIDVMYAINAYHYTKSSDRFRHNYIRTGIIIGVFIGSILGFIAAQFIPGLNLLVGTAVCGSIMGLGGGAYYGVKGEKLTKDYHHGVYSDNTWDYTTRSMASLFGFVGMLVGCFVPIPGASILLGAAFGAIGWYTGFGVVKKAREAEPEEKKSTSGWSLRSSVGSTIGSTIGGFIGFGIGCAFGGPLGGMVGLAIGSAVGGLMGWVVGALADESARKTFAKTIKSFFGIATEPSEPKALKKSLKMDKIPKSESLPIDDLDAAESEEPITAATTESLPSVSSTTSLSQSLKSTSPSGTPSPSTASPISPDGEKEDQFFLARKQPRNIIKNITEQSLTASPPPPVLVQ